MVLIADNTLDTLAATAGERPGRSRSVAASTRRARHVIVRAGVPPHALDAGGHDDADWRRLAGVMDAMYMTSGGEFGQRIFWRTSADELDGMSPVEAIETPGGVDRVIALAAERVRDREVARRR